MTAWRPLPQTNTSAPNYVIEQIRSALMKKELNPGDKLPSEGSLSEMFGVSRGSIRQAMKALETMGILTIRPGDGTYVNTEVSGNSFNPLIFSLLISKTTAESFASARFALERDIDELIIGDDEKIRKLVPQLEENLKHHQELLSVGAATEELVKNDLAFHSLISAACGNPLLQIVYNYVMDAFEVYMIETTSLQAGDLNNVTVRDHRAIIDAFKENSFADAKQAAKDSVTTWYKLLEKN